MNKQQLKEKLAELHSWKPIQLENTINHGDMPGDIVQIHDANIAIANTIFPILVKEMEKVDSNKIVVSVYGCSGSGKTVTSSILYAYLKEAGIPVYLMSGDNYPRRIPMYNDAERISIFRSSGLKGMLSEGDYSKENQKILNELWESDEDSNPEMVEKYPFLASYQKHGRKALKEYLGTYQEQDYDELNDIISKFKNGDETIWLKKMGRKESERWYDEVSFGDINVLLLEWTHGINENLKNIDIPLLLNSTPEETKAYRVFRARDVGADSHFVTMVLSIEQEELDSRAKYSKIIISKSGEVLDPKDF